MRNYFDSFNFHLYVAIATLGVHISIHLVTQYHIPEEATIVKNMYVRFQHFISPILYNLNNININSVT